MAEIKALGRDANGLLENIEYVIDDNGRINWRKMIAPQFLVLNTQYQTQIEEAYGKPIAEIQVSEVEDKYLLILLGGIKELARLRGFHSVSYDIEPASERCIAATCHIDWIANFETEGRSITFGDGADATIENTTGFGKSFLTTIAINRAFVRSVKNFLGINILGHDEICSKITPASPEEADNQLLTKAETSFHGRLREVMDAAKIDFEVVKKTCAKSDEAAKEWTTIEDIPKATALELIGRINTKIKKK